MEKILDIVGFFGPLINFCISFVCLWNQKIYLWFYLVFYLMNSFINKLFKTIIREPRPTGGKSLISIEKYDGIEEYGMPSGHAQSSMFSLTYLYLVKQSPSWLLIELFIAILTLYQRWNYRRHTIQQLFVGSVVGIVFAYISFVISKRYLRTL